MYSNVCFFSYIFHAFNHLPCSYKNPLTHNDTKYVQVINYKITTKHIYLLSLSYHSYIIIAFRA